ncbi:unnamed protein product [Adineta steineri]|uniref:Twinfilin n=1 Tax=Adineta steineri TaxID=433720 RepID=A0A815B079_9BILA|nr:unnamed protein product [Adineta steineri]CAF1266924.1 unnamed protein product [Adineta steineri]CAF1284221.1 unnamed protein product [Adineta steineri]CAF1461286.1 unnamed protein product [Adineta steineri]CAF3696917.1 unnamed protein product [Adineta steineri]
MSHQSGITASDSLRDKFADMKDGHIRLVVVAIENEKLVAKEEHNAVRTFTEDFDQMIPPLVQKNRPAYYFIRLDTISEISGHNWLLIVYIPDEARVRERMLYASTVATLKREFGLTYITQEFHASSKSEMTSHSFEQHVRTQAAPPPLTMREEEMLEIHQREATADISIDTRHPTLQGLTFPLDENVIEALHLFKKHNVDYIQLEIDHEKERILLSHSESHATPEHIQKCLPSQQGRYHIYRLKHDYNQKQFDSIFFLYSVPGSGSKVKQRMMYASCKESVIDNIEKRMGIIFDKKLELCDPTDLTMEYLMQELHPEILANKAKSSFAKPKAPSSRGPRRLLKTADTPDE